MKIKLIIISAFITLLSVCGYQHKKISKLDNELGLAISNGRYYESLVSNTEEKNRVLQLTIDQLNNTSDSLLQQVKTAQKELKIKDQNLKQAQVINNQYRNERHYKG